MKLSVLAITFLFLAAPLVLPASAVADDTNADCQVRENGKDKKAKTGPCHVFEARGHVWILLPTGDWFVLRPKNKADRFVDQNGKDVKRDFAAGAPAYHWPHRHITVNLRP